jgi:hypothetical protein
LTEDAALRIHRYVRQLLPGAVVELCGTASSMSWHNNEAVKSPPNDQQRDMHSPARVLVMAELAGLSRLHPKETGSMIQLSW